MTLVAVGTSYNLASMEDILMVKIADINYVGFVMKKYIIAIFNGCFLDAVWWGEDD